VVKKYTKEFLISELHRFVDENNRVPFSHDMTPRNGYPSYTAYQNHFESWNGALIAADLFPMRMKRINEKCSICGGLPSKTSQWYIRNESIICNKCYARDRDRINGILDINSCVGKGLIAEYIYLLIHPESINLNNINFNGKYDVYNEQYSYIDIKSSSLRKDLDRKNYYSWNFRITRNKVLPDTYICIGFSEDENSVEKVWIIPNTSSLINKAGICISSSKRGLSRAQQYEVDPTTYNEVYQNLDIYSLPEFCNLPRGDTT